jgi:hypothetical protein
VRNVAYIGKTRNIHKILVRIPERKHHLGSLGTDGRVMLKRILKEIRCRMLTEFILLQRQALANTIMNLEVP